MVSLSLVIIDAIHNHLPPLPCAYYIHWQLARIDSVKDFIFSQTRIRASNKQVIAVI